MLCPGPHPGFHIPRSVPSPGPVNFGGPVPEGGSKVTPRRHRAHISYLSAVYWLPSTSQRLVGHSADLARLSGTYVQGLYLYCLPEVPSAESSQTPNGCFLSGKPPCTRGMAEGTIRGSCATAIPPAEGGGCAALSCILNSRL